MDRFPTPTPTKKHRTMCKKQCAFSSSERRSLKSNHKTKEPQGSMSKRKYLPKAKKGNNKRQRSKPLPTCRCCGQGDPSSECDGNGEGKPCIMNGAFCGNCHEWCHFGELRQCRFCFEESFQKKNIQFALPPCRLTCACCAQKTPLSLAELKLRGCDFSSLHRNHYCVFNRCRNCRDKCDFHYPSFTQKEVLVACRLCLLRAFSPFDPTCFKDTYFRLHDMFQQDKKLIETCQVVKESNVNNYSRQVFYDVVGEKNIELLAQLLGSGDLIPLVLDYLCSHLVRNITPALVTTWDYGTIKSESVYQLQVQAYQLSWPELGQAFKKLVPRLLYCRADNTLPLMERNSAAEMFCILPSEVRDIHLVSLCASSAKTSGWLFGDGGSFSEYWFGMVIECKKHLEQTLVIPYLAKFCFVALRNPYISGEILMKALYFTASLYSTLEEGTFAGYILDDPREPSIPLTMQDRNECIKIWQEKLDLLDPSEKGTALERRMLEGFIEFALNNKKWETVDDLHSIVKAASYYSSVKL